VIDLAAEQRRLAELVAIPGISAKAFPPEEVRRSAEAVAETMVEYGLEGVRVLETGGHPAVYGELTGSSGSSEFLGSSVNGRGTPRNPRNPEELPTILIYGHHDVQPPGREERWLSPPFAASVRDGRMYGRGTSDDKGGFLAYLAAIRASAPPCNIKLLVEGEEEIGSPNLGALLAEHRALFACDFIVLCDTPNFDTGVPALTYRLRGNCIVDVEVRCLTQPLHSGQGGGLVPDAIAALCTIVARLQEGIPGLDERVHVDESQLAAMHALPFDGERIRADFGLLDGVELRGSSWEQVWARPSLTVTAIEAVPIARAANQLSDSARARLSLRTVRDLGTPEAGELLANAIRSYAPHGVQVDVKIVGGPSWWEADPAHPVFAKAKRALARGFGREPVMIGSGGSIGFVAPFAELAGDTPPLLTGVQDPRSAAHSENESLHLGDWEKAMISAVHLFRELAS
jgi:cysteinylglycine-S-conjugate dipeptidase